MERKLTAIMAADVVGYSRLMGADEAGTHGALKALRAEVVDPRIAEHHGRIVKLMGDGALVEFASVVDALTCAVAIQREMSERDPDAPADKRIAFRIGINLGDIIVDGDDIYGNGVNVAARLEALAEPGGICLSGRVLDQVEKNVDVGFAFLGPQTVKNIDKPVNAYKVLLDPADAGRIVDVPKPQAPGSKWLIAAVVALVVAVGGAGLWFHQTRPAVESASVANLAVPLPEKPSIAVLPFDNISNDPKQEYFSDGITDDVITDLSKISGLLVIARNTTFALKGKAVDISEVAKNLGVRYVLEGSVRRAGERVRINAQLIDAATGGHLWAERYDGAIGDVFTLQDEVTGKIVTALAVRVTSDEKVRRQRLETTSSEAYDAFLRGWEHYRKQTPEHFAKARDYFERAVELDPDYARAYAALAWIYWEARFGGWWDALGLNPYAASKHARELLLKAMTKPTSLAHQVASDMALWRGRYQEAMGEAEKAVTLGPNDADSISKRAEILIYAGHPEEALRDVALARRLDPNNAAWHSLLEGMAQFGLERYDLAVASLEESLELNPDLWAAQLLCAPCIPLAAAYAHLGHIREARDMVQRLKAPGWHSMDTQSLQYYVPYKDASDWDRLAEGLRRAGLPATPGDFK